MKKPDGLARTGKRRAQKFSKITSEKNVSNRNEEFQLRRQHEIDRSGNLKKL
jgi:hypothetical protein